MDLGKFAGKTEVPLYPVCREWIRNQRDPDEIFFHPFDDQEEQSSKPVVGSIHRLPNPLPINPDEVNPEYGARVPKNVFRPTPRSEEVDQGFNTRVDDENMSQLLTHNVERWKSVRKEWRNAAHTNELRYKHSCDVLTAMFEKYVPT